MVKFILVSALLGVVASGCLCSTQYTKQFDHSFFYTIAKGITSDYAKQQTDASYQPENHVSGSNTSTTGNAKIYFLFGGIILLLSSGGTILYYRNKQLKLQYLKLSETIKHTEWGFLVTKEFITENHIAYDELERILNREKGINNINAELYNRLHDVLSQQKANYSGHLLHRLTHLDGNFGAKFQKLFPDFSTDDFLLASMIHHQWKVTDMTTIFHISPDAVRKRKNRLNQKISTRMKREIDLDEFLTHL